MKVYELGQKYDLKIEPLSTNGFLRMRLDKKGGFIRKEDSWFMSQCGDSSGQTLPPIHHSR